MDILLFQYGIYDWGNEYGEHFSFDIPRQSVSPEEDEPYQLNLALIYHPENFTDLKSYNCWSNDFSKTEDFLNI